MESKTLASLMKIAVFFTAVCGLFICVFVIPSFGESIIYSNPEFSSWYWPWLIFAWLYSLPCFVVLIDVWRVSNSVKNETVFSLKTAKLVRSGVILLLCDAAFLFVGNIFFLLLNMNHPGVVLISVIIVIFETVAALFAAILSRYLTKASVLQEESDGTL